MRTIKAVMMPHIKKKKKKNSKWDILAIKFIEMNKLGNSIA